MENMSRNRKVEKLSLEDYVRFTSSGKHYDLTCELLKQVMHMHGFIKGKKTKSLMRDAVESLELMDPRRSTLKDDGISANAFISMGEIVKDLVELKWQECCITSIQMVNSSNYNIPAALNSPVITTKPIGIDTSSSSSILVKKKMTNKKRNLAAIEDATTREDGEGAVGSAESACCSGGEGEGEVACQEQGITVRNPFVVRKARSKTKTFAHFV